MRCSAAPAITGAVRGKSPGSTRRDIILQFKNVFTLFKPRPVSLTL
jgi:hypothetical protein